MEDGNYKQAAVEDGEWVCIYLSCVGLFISLPYKGLLIFNEDEKGWFNCFWVLTFEYIKMGC